MFNMKVYQKYWHLRNKEKIKLYKEKNKDKILKQAKEYYKNNRKSIIEKAKKYYLKHRLNKLKYTKKYNQIHKKEYREYKRKYYHQQQKGEFICPSCQKMMLSKSSLTRHIKMKRRECEFVKMKNQLQLLGQTIVTIST